MTQVHMSEAEVAREIHAVLEKVRQGVEVIVEQDHRPVAIIKTPQRPGRPIDECIAIARAHSSGATLDDDFARDLEEIAAHRRPLDASVWD
jgi:antitoxin (DNA-binding transcriptional repressor) of toxin-antitoxin stability system